jgi:hypothetical protein
MVPARAPGLVEASHDAMHRCRVYCACKSTQAPQYHLTQAMPSYCARSPAAACQPSPLAMSIQEWLHGDGVVAHLVRFTFVTVATRLVFVTEGHPAHRSGIPPAVMAFHSHRRRMLTVLSHRAPAPDNQHSKHIQLDTKRNGPAMDNNQYT